MAKLFNSFDDITPGDNITLIYRNGDSFDGEFLGFDKHGEHYYLHAVIEKIVKTTDIQGIMISDKAHVEPESFGDVLDD